MFINRDSLIPYFLVAAVQPKFEIITQTIAKLKPPLPVVITKASVPPHKHSTVHSHYPSF